MKKRSRGLPCRSFCGTSSMPRCSTTPTWSSDALLIPFSFLLALPSPQLLQRGNTLNGSWFQTFPDHAPRPVSLLSTDGDGSRRRDDQINASIKFRACQVKIDDLAVMGGTHHQGIISQTMHLGEHGPFQIKVAMSLAEADAIGADGGSPGHQQIKATERADIEQVQRLAEAIHAIEGRRPAVIVRGDAGRVDEKKAASDAIGGHDKTPAILHRFTTYHLQVIIQRDKHEFTLLPGGESLQTFSANLGAFIIGNKLGEVPVKTRIRSCNRAQLRPHMLADRLSGENISRFHHYSSLFHRTPVFNIASGVTQEYHAGAALSKDFRLMEYLPCSMMRPCARKIQVTFREEQPVRRREKNIKG